MQNYNSKFKIKKITIILIIFNLLIGMFLIFQPNRLEFSKAAIFDAPLLPGNDNQYNLGSNASIQRWRNAALSGNMTIFNTATTSGNLSIGTTTIADRLYVTNGNITQELSSFTPILVSNVDTENRPRSIYISGKYAYIGIDTGTTGKFQIFDISNPYSPQSIKFITLAERFFDIFVSGRYAYIPIFHDTSSLFRIFDISNPNSPYLAGQTTPLSIGKYPISLYISGNYAYLVNKGSNSLDIINIANPTSPQFVASSSLGGEASFGDSIFVSGRYAYVLNNEFNKTFKVFDVSNQKNPQLVGFTSIGPNTDVNRRSLYVSGRYVYIANMATSADFQVVDVSNPANPQLINSIQVDGDAGTVFVSGKYAYVEDYSNKNLTIIDISNPLNLKIVSSNTMQNRFEDIFVSGHYLYAVTLANTLEIYDISGMESVSANIHSLEAGNLQVRNDIIAQGQLQITGGINVGTGGIFSAGPIGVSIASTTQTDAVSAYFQGRVGIATTTPTQKLEVNGGIRLYGNSELACDATGGPSTRGTLRFTLGASDFPDTLEICNSSSTDGYVWKKLY